MKKAKIVLCVFLAVLILLCVLSAWRDISVYVPQRLAEAGERIAEMAEQIFSRFADSMEDTFTEVSGWYDELVS